MARLLFWDTETNGLPLWKDPSWHPGQPHIVQLGTVLVDVDEDLSWSRAASSSLIVKPDGWEIPQEVIDVHGITMERAMDEGARETDVLATFEDYLHHADEALAFNDPFDGRIMRIAFKRYRDDARAEAWKAYPRSCVMKMARPFCNIAPTDAMMATGRKTSKQPKLEEAHEILLGEAMTGAHDALNDALAAMEVYFEIKRREREATAEGQLHLLGQGNQS